VLAVPARRARAKADAAALPLFWQGRFQRQAGAGSGVQLLAKQVPHLKAAKPDSVGWRRRCGRRWYRWRWCRWRWCRWSGAGGGGAGAGGAAGVSGGGTGGVVQGSLGVTLTGVQTGSTASVAINGPASFTRTISATTTVQRPPAVVTRSARTDRVPGTQVDSVYDATGFTGSPANVALGATVDVHGQLRATRRLGHDVGDEFLDPHAYGFDATTIAKTGTHDDAPAVSLNVLNVGTNGPRLLPRLLGDRRHVARSCKNNRRPSG